MVVLTRSHEKRLSTRQPNHYLQKRFMLAVLAGVLWWTFQSHDSSDNSSLDLLLLQQQQHTASDIPSNHSTSINSLSNNNPLLYYLGQALSSSQPTRQTLTHAIRFYQPRAIYYDDITLVSHCSTDRLDRVLMQAQRWTGPISVAVYVTTPLHIDDLESFAHRHARDFANTTFHIYAENAAEERERGYPNNILRNLALDHIATDYALLLDADLVTQPNAYAGLTNLLHNHTRVVRELQSRAFLVLPAFEGNLTQIPNTKEEMVQAFNKNKVQKFHQDDFHWGHKPTNYKLWRKNTSSTFYRVPYVRKYEPYVVAYRYGLPRYFEPLRNGYYDKVSFFSEARFRGYKFLVLRDYFVYHPNDKFVNRVPSTPLRSKKPYFFYVRYLQHAYNVTKPSDFPENPQDLSIGGYRSKARPGDQ